MSEFRYKCSHGVGLDEECPGCRLDRHFKDHAFLESYSNLAHSPTYQQALSRHQAAPGIRFRWENEVLGRMWEDDDLRYGVNTKNPRTDHDARL